ncbi:solute carrier family 22 member 16-like [Amblyomma americanum]
MPQHRQDGQLQERHAVSCRAWDYDTAWPEDSIVSRWDLVCERAWMYQLSPLTYMLGAVLFAPVAGLLADRVGRRPIISVAVATLLLPSMGACVADTFFYFLLTRLTVSGSTHSIVMLLYILLYEVTGSERRFVFVLIDTALPFTLVPRMVEALSWLRPHWFLVQVFILVPTGLLASCCYLLEESPVWLLATWRLQEAEQLMLAAARQNGVNQTRARNSYRLLREQLAKVQAEASSCGFNSRLRVAHFHTRVVTVALSWFTLTLVLYSFTLRPAEPPNEILELVHMCLQALCYVLIYRYMHLRGHLSGLLVGFGLLGASMILQAVFAYGAQEHAARLCEMVVHCASYCAVSLIYGYTAEVYPTVMRSIGMALSFDD